MKEEKIKKEKKNKKSKKGKRLLKALIAILVVLLVLAAVLAVLYYYAREKAPVEDPVAETYAQLAEEHDELSYDEEDNSLFVNNELIIVAEEGTEKAEIDKIISAYDGYIAEDVGDIGIYKIKFNKSYEYDKLEKIVDEISDESVVADVYISEVTLLEDDTAPDDELPKRKAIYPDDPWNCTTDKDVTWDEIPVGDNWGMEAINAPEAWGYFDELSTTKVGLIDAMPDMSHKDLNVAEAYAIFNDKKSGEIKSGTVTNKVLSAERHGTHVAGTMMATWNNNTGVSGVLADKGELYYAAAYTVEGNTILSEYTTPFNYFMAIKTLVDNDVQAINISQNTGRVQGFAASQGNEAAIKDLNQKAKQLETYLERLIEKRESNGEKDFVICLSAGNSNSTMYCESSRATYGYEQYDKYNPWHYFKTKYSGGSEARYNNYIALIESEDVKDRIIVVGSVKMIGEERYCYSAFSCVGERVDIVAPGENIASTVPDNKLEALNGTSMAAPHVTGAAGAVFGANPELTGPEVKSIVCASVNGRYYHGNYYSGLLDLNQAVRNALLTRDNSVNRVVTKGHSGLDVCFVVDTTGSMSDDIQNAKDNMQNIIANLEEKSSDYRVALVDYRDFSSYGRSDDYPAKTQFDFTNESSAIISGINKLDLGDGGDGPETVYSGLVESLELDWRPGAKKVIIIIGDAEPKDPEPNTGYTYEDIVLMLYEADISIDLENSDDRVLGDAEKSMINVFTIGTSASSDAADFFEEISAATGGAYTETDDASQVSSAIIGSIDSIEVEFKAVNLDFGSDNSDEMVDLYLDGDYVFSVPLNSQGRFKLENASFGDYEWKIERLQRSGSFVVDGEEDDISTEGEDKWYTIILVLWERHRVATISGIIGALILLIIIIRILIFIKKSIKRAINKSKERRIQKTAEKKSRKEPLISDETINKVINSVPIQKNVENITAEPVGGVAAEPVNDITVEPTSDVTVEPVNDVTVEPVNDVTVEPVNDVSVEPVNDVSVEPVNDVSVEPVNDVTVEPVNDVSVEHVNDVTVEHVNDVTVEPVNDVTVEPVNDVTVEPVNDVTVEPVNDVTVEPVNDVTVEPANDVTVETMNNDYEEKTQVNSAPKFCGNCGSKVNANEKFCGICGQKL